MARTIIGYNGLKPQDSSSYNRFCSFDRRFFLSKKKIYFMLKYNFFNLFNANFNKREKQFF